MAKFSYGCSFINFSYQIRNAHCVHILYALTTRSEKPLRIYLEYGTGFELVDRVSTSRL